MQEGLGFQEKLRQLAKLLQEAWPRVQPSRRFMGSKGSKGCKIGTLMHVELVLCIPAGTDGMHQAWGVQRGQTGEKIRSLVKIKCRSALFSAGQLNRVPMDDSLVKIWPVGMQIEAPEVSFPIAQTLHQNSSCAKSYALFREVAQTRSNRDDPLLQPNISPPPGLGCRRFLNQK